MYRRNVDTRIRELERKAAAGDEFAFNELIIYLFRSGYNPYWIRVREITAGRDRIESDTELREGDPSIPRWENREPSQDRHWIFYLHIPMRGGTQLIVSLGEMTCELSPEETYLQGCLVSKRDWNDWDDWVERAQSPPANPNEVARANMALAGALQGGGIAFQDRALFNADLPLGWTPELPILPTNVVALSIDPSTGETLRPYGEYAQQYREGDPLTIIPDKPFLVEDYLFARFYNWLKGPHVAEYANRLKAACCPLNYRLPTQYQGRHIWLYYWKVFDRDREIIAEPDDYHPDRTVYEVGYAVKWKWGYNARFYRWGHEPGHDEEGRYSSALSRSIVVNADRPIEEHIAARVEVEQKSEEALQKRLAKMVAIANKWRYRVLLINAEPSKDDDPYPSNWKAGMQYTSRGPGDATRVQDFR